MKSFSFSQESNSWSMSYFWAQHLRPLSQTQEFFSLLSSSNKKKSADDINSESYGVEYTPIQGFDFL